MSGNDERVETYKTIHHNEYMEMLRREREMAENHRRWAQERAAHYMAVVQEPRFRDKITQASIALFFAFLINVFVVLLCFWSGTNWIVTSVVGIVCGTQAAFWFILMLDELEIKRI